MLAHTKRALASALGSLTAMLALAVSGAAQIPDVIVYDIGVDGGDTNDIHYWGQSGGIAAYSIATQSCNAGTTQVDWFTGGSTLHPVIGQNMFRLKDGRFEHIGQSWLKHGFCAVNETETFCAPCQSTPCDTLGVGCADTYWATLNDGGSGQSKRNVNAAAGSHVHGGGPTGTATIRGRLQVNVADIDPAQNPGAEYFIEGHYVTQDDAQAGEGGNNASWRRVSVASVSDINGGGATSREEPAIFAWKSIDNSVEIKLGQNSETDGKTFFYVAFKVTQLGPNLWDYEYAIQNLNSDQSAGSLSIPLNTNATLDSTGFHDVFYHSGDPYDGTDWPAVRNGGELGWATTPFGTNVNANALRWGTLYNFRLQTNAPPERGALTIGLFKPGPNTSLVVNSVWVPTGEPAQILPPRTANRPGPAGPPAGPVFTPFTTSTPRHSPANPPLLLEERPAVVGGTWQAGVELGDGIEESLVFVSFAGASEGTSSSLGEVLVRPPVRRLAGGSFELPNDPALVGRTFSAQAAVRTPAGWRLTNALDVTIAGR